VSCSARDRIVVVQEERGVVVQETEEGQCKRQGSCNVRDRGVVVQETGEF
jgi:hypothetical protein